MGSSNSTQININLERPNRVYLSGEIVTGVADVIVTENINDVDGVYIDIVGESGYTTTRTIRDSRGSSRQETQYHHIRFFKSKVNLTVEEKGPNEAKLQSGNYSWPFSFQLPNDLPPSLNAPGSYPHVRYYVRFVIDRPWYKIDPKQTLYFIVIPRVNVMQNPALLIQSQFGKHNRKDVSLNGVVDRLVYMPGENISGRFEIHNPEHIKVKEIKLKLIQFYRIHGQSRKGTISEIIFPTIINAKDEYIQQQFSLAVPSMALASTYEFHGGYDQRTDVSNSYSLEFDVNVAGIFTDFDVPVPITIASESDDHGRQRGNGVMSNNFQDPISLYGSMSDPTATLPSYEQVMNEKN